MQKLKRINLPLLIFNSLPNRNKQKTEKMKEKERNVTGREKTESTN